MTGLELYIHIPFCVRKCNYCDFLSFASDDETKEKYVDALIQEIKFKAPLYQDDIVSIFIGGGTPSILEIPHVQRIIKALKECWNLDGLQGKPKTFFRKKAVNPTIEFTIECNPGTLNEEKLKAYKKMGVNRLSLGLQSINDAELKELGRIHRASDFIESFNAARMAGFTNINVDLMQAIPLQTLSSWRKTLMSVATLRPEHISAYSLIIEEGTPFYERQKSKLPLAVPDEDEEREIYHVTKDILEQFGYHRYEISNYSLPGFECTHNKGYWQRRNYLGLGLGASSMVDNVRWKNTSDMKEYLKMPAYKGTGNAMESNLADQDFYQSGENCGSCIRCEEEKLSSVDQMAEYMFLGLRMNEGITKEKFIKEFGVSYDYVYGEISSKLIEQGLLKEVDFEYEDELGIRRSDTMVYLTDLGVDVSNTVFAEFMP